MEVALFNLMSMNHPGETPGAVIHGTARLVQMAEEAGFDGAWFAEHHFSSIGVCASPLMMAVHCAALTRTIKLGPAVVVLPFYHPLRLVEEIAFLDLASNGRALLGLGAGHQPHEFRSFGIDQQARHGRAMEAWDILEMGLQTGQVTYQGQHFTVPRTFLAARPQGNRRLPTFVAGSDPDILGRAARSGATPFISQGYKALPAAAALRAHVAGVFAAAGVPDGAMPLAVQRYVFVTKSPDEARRAAEGMLRAARNIIALRSANPARNGVHLLSGPFDGEPSVEWLLRHAPIGEPAHCAEVLSADVDALRPSHLSVFMGFSGLEPGRVQASLDLFGTGVLPQLRGMAAGMHSLDRVA